MDPQELIDTLPPVVKAFVMTGRPGLKDQPADPADFYGREGELATLMRAVQTVTTGQTKTTARPAAVIAAAPGAGKTSLLHAFERKLAEAGIGHIRLDPKDLLSPEVFSNAVKEHPPLLLRQRECGVEENCEHHRGGHRFRYSPHDLCHCQAGDPRPS